MKKIVRKTFERDRAELGEGVFDAAGVIKTLDTLVTEKTRKLALKKIAKIVKIQKIIEFERRMEGPATSAWEEPPLYKYKDSTLKI